MNHMKIAGFSRGPKSNTAQSESTNIGKRTIKTDRVMLLKPKNAIDNERGLVEKGASVEVLEIEESVLCEGADAALDIEQSAQ